MPYKECQLTFSNGEKHVIEEWKYTTMLTDESIEADQWQNVVSFTFNTRNWVGDNFSLDQLIVRMPKLTTLRIHSCLDDKSLINILCKLNKSEINTVDLSYNNIQDLTIIARFIRECPNLTTLKVSYNSTHALGIEMYDASGSDKLCEALRARKGGTTLTLDLTGYQFTKKEHSAITKAADAGNITLTLNDPIQTKVPNGAKGQNEELEMRKI